MKQEQWNLTTPPDLSTAVEQEPDLAESYCNRGFAHSKKAQWGSAIAEYDQAIILFPRAAQSRFDREWSTDLKSKWNNVITDYSRIIELNSGDTSPAGNQDNLSIEEEWALAIADYNKVIEISENPDLVQKGKDAIEFITEMRQDIGM